jgi:hypothetical protein
LPLASFVDQEKQSGLDRTFSKNRVSLVFSSSSSPIAPYTTTIDLTLLAAPNSRVSSVVLRLNFADGTIASLSPSSHISAPTDVQHTEGTTVSGGGNVGTSGALPAQAGLNLSLTQSREASYVRKTWGRIQGSGIGFREAEWVLEEDLGSAGRHGVLEGCTERFVVTTTVRPALVEYEVDVAVVEGEGSEPGFFNTRRHKSGSQKIVLP